MTAIDTQTDIPTTGDMVDEHREAALAHADRAENLTQAMLLLRVTSEQHRRMSQQCGVALKLASVHAHLAYAIALSGARS